MINTHTPFSLAIAAFVARYALVSIPGTELSDGAQGVNQSPIDLAFELSERQLGATIGYPALVYGGSETRTFGPHARCDVCGNPAAEAVSSQLLCVDHAAEMRETWHISDIFNEDASDVQRDLDPLIDTHGTVEDLRLALDLAHQHIGALVARGAQMEADLIAIADHEIQTTGDDPVQAIRDLLAAISTLQDIAANATAGIAHDHHSAEGYGPATERNNAIDAARAWLRRAQQ